MQNIDCQNCKNSFVVTHDDLEFYEKIQVPVPTFCPACRFQRRAAWINTHNLYIREVLSVGKVVSMYSPDRKLHIVPDQQWWTDAYDVLAYGREYDFRRPMFSQLHDLLSLAPLPHMQREYSSFENSEYCNASSKLKNCYLVFNTSNCEECLYGWSIQESKCCADVSFVKKSELCYESTHLLNCYRCRNCEDCEDCNNLEFCTDCVGCTECIGCIGLRHKQHHIFNQAHTPEEYAQKRATMNSRSYAESETLREKSQNFFLQKPRKFMHGRSNNNVTGDYLYQCNNVTESFIVKKAEDCHNVQFLQYLDSPTLSSRDYTMFGIGSEQMYEDAWCGLGCNNVKFSLWNYRASEIEYCMGCHYSSKLFACFGLRHKSFCILNKQYTEQEYRDLVRRIKDQMNSVPYVDRNNCEYRYGEFLPIELSLFAYNQTLAQEYYPLSKEESLKKSYDWHEGYTPKSGRVLHWRNIPDRIDTVDDVLISQPILCQAYEEDPVRALEHHCSQYFKVIPQELALYRTLGIALPRCCPKTRYHRRMRSMNELRTWKRSCAKCNKTIQTTYSPDRPEIVYCGECHMKEVY